MKRNIKKTLPSGRPSICEWELVFSFKTREQCSVFIQKIFAMDLNVMPKFSFWESEIGGVPKYNMRIEYTWADRLVEFAEILAEVDYKEQ